VKFLRDGTWPPLVDQVVLSRLIKLSWAMTQPMTTIGRKYVDGELEKGPVAASVLLRYEGAIGRKSTAGQFTRTTPRRARNDWYRPTGTIYKTGPPEFTVGDVGKAIGKVTEKAKEEVKTAAEKTKELAARAAKETKEKAKEAEAEAKRLAEEAKKLTVTLWKKIIEFLDWLKQKLVINWGYVVGGIVLLLVAYIVLRRLIG